MFSNYLRDDCHKQAVTHIRESRRFESMYTLEGETRPTRHIRFPLQSTYARRTLFTGSPYTWQPFKSHRQDCMDTTAPEKKCSRLHLSARLSGPRDLPQFLSQHSHWSSRLKPSTCGWPATRLTGPISPACDWYVQYLLRGTNPSVFNQHRWGLPHRNLGIATALSPPFPSECSTSHPKWPRPVSILSTTLLSKN
jgi:hypothetical protein